LLAAYPAKVLSRIFDIAVEDPNKALLGLTATINEKHPKYNTIVTVLPPIKKYMLDEAVKEGRGRTSSTGFYGIDTIINL
jgi:hypothetical protein